MYSYKTNVNENAPHPYVTHLDVAPIFCACTCEICAQWCQSPYQSLCVYFKEFGHGSVNWQMDTPMDTGLILLPRLLTWEVKIYQNTN